MVTETIMGIPCHHDYLDYDRHVNIMLLGYQAQAKVIMVVIHPGTLIPDLL